MAAETGRKTDWLSKTKKTLSSTAKNIENNGFSIELNNKLNAGNKIKLDLWPTWKGEDII